MEIVISGVGAERVRHLWIRERRLARLASLNRDNATPYFAQQNVTRLRWRQPLKIGREHP